jgi:TatD DNase family protein
MLIDTHCHLNFKAFSTKDRWSSGPDGKVEEVIRAAKRAGVNYIVVPGTDVETSKKAVEIAEKYPEVYAAVGIHPHHVFEIFKTQVSFFSTVSSRSAGPRRLSKKQKPSLYLSELKNIEKLLTHPKVVAIGEVGIDRHIYRKTKYQDYKIEEKFIELQKEFLKEQIKLAVKYDKSLILHSREAKKDTLEVLSEPALSKALAGKAVFHCCEPDEEILGFAIDHKIFIGVDGDITYRKDKQEFIKKVPLEMLVLETDSPFLSPDQKSMNEPKNIKPIAEFIAKLLNCSLDSLSKQTTENAKRLFKIS